MSAVYIILVCIQNCRCLLIEKIYLCGITATPPNKEIHKTALGAAKDGRNNKMFLK
jgi:hypothetical protein